MRNSNVVIKMEFGGNICLKDQWKQNLIKVIYKIAKYINYFMFNSKLNHGFYLHSLEQYENYIEETTGKLEFNLDLVGALPFGFRRIENHEL